MSEISNAKLDSKKMILIDDDPTYCAVMRKVAAKNNISLDIFQSIMEVSAAANEVRDHYQAAIIDFDLGQVNGIEITGYLGALLGEVPMILVSASDRQADVEKAKIRIRAFMNKSSGFESILRQADAACEEIAIAS
jgi:DNA-binding NtrC family response regulator